MGHFIHFTMGVDHYIHFTMGVVMQKKLWQKNLVGSLILQKKSNTNLEITGCHVQKQRDYGF
jgi:hypothetical protein